jgi:polar amino acid transport system substrate-binding protein
MRSLLEIGSELTPTGKMRAPINLGNPILAMQDPSSGELRGVSVDLAYELARRLEVRLAIDPGRALDISYTLPYVLIEGAYLVRLDSPIRSKEEVDRTGNRVVVGAGSAYDLYLSREIKAATLVCAPTSPAVTDTFIGQKLEVAAGVRQQLETDARRLPGACQGYDSWTVDSWLSTKLWARPEVAMLLPAT